jgi:hypothetical protein
MSLQFVFRIVACLLAALWLCSCATPPIGGVVLPTKVGSGFSLPRAQGISAVYLREFPVIYLPGRPDVPGIRYGCLILQESGACMFTFGLADKPSASELAAIPGTAGRYVINGKHIIIETYSWDNSGRRFVIKEGTISDGRLVIDGARFRESKTLNTERVTYRRYPIGRVDREMNW